MIGAAKPTINGINITARSSQVTSSVIPLQIIRMIGVKVNMSTGSKNHNELFPAAFANRAEAMDTAATTIDDTAPHATPKILAISVPI